MTEPNESSGTAVPEVPVRAPAAVSWPALPSGASRASGPEIRDAAVEALLDGLRTLPSAPVSSHGEAYAALHDGLLEALNEDPAAQAPAGPLNVPGDSAP